MAVVFVSSDLMAASRVEGSATRLNVPLRTAMSMESAAASTADGKVELLIIDLASIRTNIAAAVSLLRIVAAPPARILAFGPHVHARMLDAAKDAGCDEVITRGQFFSGLDAILAAYAPSRS
jgi:hypothetical protein